MKALALRSVTKVRIAQRLISKETAVLLCLLGDTRSCYDVQNEKAAEVVAVSSTEKTAAFCFGF